MKVFLGVLGVLGVVAVFTFMSVVSIGNDLVGQDEAVKSAFAQVQNVYQRRMDLIPNLVNTVKGYAAHEQQTLEGVIQARAAATKVNVSANDITPEKLQALQGSQGALGSALGRLMVVVEKYPDLKANENFKELQSQLEGTENGIANERRTFNKVTQSYNQSIRSFPTSFVASMRGFQQKPYFEADKGANVAPKVQF